jgi:hypothetical protein
MNITRFNFAKNRSKILKDLKNCDVIAFDFEMSGVLANNKFRNTNQDTVSIRHFRLKSNAKPASIQILEG